MDHGKIKAELDVLREFIDFVNRQVGVYCDCLSGFQGNKVRIERQMPRVQRPTSRRIVDGQPVITWASVEDPARPDVLHHRIIRADEFINDNSEAGYNEQQICWANAAVGRQSQRGGDIDRRSTRHRISSNSRFGRHPTGSAIQRLRSDSCQPVPWVLILS